MSKQYVQQWNVHSFTTDDSYRVSLDENNIYSCSCNGWIFQRGYPKPTEKRPHPTMRALHNGVLCDKHDLDRLGVHPNGHCKHIVFILHEHNAISAAVANRSSIRIGDHVSGFYVEVREGRVLAVLDALGVKPSRPSRR